MVKRKSSRLIPEERPSFFKIMFANKSTEPLRIPPAFVKYISEGGSDEVTLKGPCGGHWRVKLVEKKCRGIFLEDGWKEFVRQNSLGDYEFLIFRYDGNMCFNVKIFDKSGCKRANVPVAGAHQQPPAKRGPGRPRKIPVAPPQLHQPKPRENGNLEEMKGKGIAVKTEPGETELPDAKQESQLEEFDDTRRKCKAAAKKTVSGRKRRFQRKGSLEGGVSLSARKNLASFTSKFPYFRKQLVDYNTERVFILSIPSPFSVLHLPTTKSEFVLQNPEERAWAVTVVPSRSGRSHTLSKGWREFACDNLLKVGDSCIFELVDKHKMKVHFFRSEQTQH